MLQYGSEIEVEITKDIISQP